MFYKGTEAISSGQETLVHLGSFLKIALAGGGRGLPLLYWVLVYFLFKAAPKTTRLLRPPPH